jgi:cytosine deaminase
MNSGDMLERAYLIACNSGYRDDPGPELALEMACQRGAKALGAADHGVAVGKAADFLLVNVDRAAEAVAMYPPRKRVFKRGRVVAQAGQAIFPILDPGDSAERG